MEFHHLSVVLCILQNSIRQFDVKTCRVLRERLPMYAIEVEIVPRQAEPQKRHNS